MAHAHKSNPDATRIVEWLVDNREEFEEKGISEDRIASALGLPHNEAMLAIDYLENHEQVVIWPEDPPKFLLKPGRIWAETRDEILQGQSASK